MKGNLRKSYNYTFFIKKLFFFLLDLNFLNIMLKIGLRFSDLMFISLVCLMLQSIRLTLMVTEKNFKYEKRQNLLNLMFLAFSLDFWLFEAHFLVKVFLIKKEANGLLKFVNAVQTYRILFIISKCNKGCWSFNIRKSFSRPIAFST